MSFTKLSTALNLPRLSGNGTERYTDTNEFLSPGVLVAYKKRDGYPAKNAKDAVNAAAKQARNIVRIANDELAKVVLQRKKEPAWFTATMERHFNLKANGDLAGGLLKNNEIDKAFSPKDLFTHDRRWALNRIREGMLSLSFHLNTGVYLIDMDTANRDIKGGAAVPVGTSSRATVRGYVFRWGGDKTFQFCGFRNGEVHIAFEKFPAHSLTSGARIIIHECGHKFLNVKDTFYAHNVNYPPSLEKCLTANADSFAWTAVSLAAQEVRMATNSSSDGETCPGATL